MKTIVHEHNIKVYNGDNAIIAYDGFKESFSMENSAMSDFLLTPNQSFPLPAERKHIMIRMISPGTVQIKLFTSPPAIFECRLLMLHLTEPINITMKNTSASNINVRLLVSA